MRELIDLKECIEKGLLRRIPASREKAIQSIEKAKTLLAEAKADLEAGQLNSAIIVSYLSIFHAARSLLFKDGYREKSHECIIRYLEEKYAGKISRKTIELLDKFKSERTQTQYDTRYFPTEEKAERMISFAEKFIQGIEETI